MWEGRRAERIKSKTEIVRGADIHIQRLTKGPRVGGERKESWDSCEISAASLRNREGSRLFSVKALGCNLDETKTLGRASDLG